MTNAELEITNYLKMIAPRRRNEAA